MLLNLWLQRLFSTLAGLGVAVADVMRFLWVAAFTALSTFVSFVGVDFDFYSDIRIFFGRFTAAKIRRRIRLADFFSADIRRTKIRRLIQIFGGGLGFYYILVFRNILTAHTKDINEQEWGPPIGTRMERMACRWLAFLLCCARLTICHYTKRTCCEIEKRSAAAKILHSSLLMRPGIRIWTVGTSECLSYTRYTKLCLARAQICVLPPLVREIWTRKNMKIAFKVKSHGQLKCHQNLITYWVWVTLEITSICV